MPSSKPAPVSPLRPALVTVLRAFEECVGFEGFKEFKQGNLAVITANLVLAERDPNEVEIERLRASNAELVAALKRNMAVNIINNTHVLQRDRGYTYNQAKETVEDMIPIKQARAAISNAKLLA